MKKPNKSQTAIKLLEKVNDGEKQKHYFNGKLIFKKPGHRSFRRTDTYPTTGGPVRVHQEKPTELSGF